MILLFSGFFTFAGSFKSSQDYVLLGNEISEKNLYAAGNSINIMGKANGDLLAAGGNVFVSGFVLKDMAAAAGTIDFRGSVGEDLRVAGGNLNIGGTVGGEAIALGGNINFLSGSEISGDVFVAGGTVVIDGKINGDLDIAGGTVQINGSVGGDVNVKDSENLILGNNAAIKGKLDYSSPKEADISGNAKVAGGINFKKIDTKDISVGNKKAKKAGMAGFFGFLSFWWFTKMIMLMVAAFVLYLVFKNKVQKTVESSISNFWIEMLRGFVILVVLPVAIIISFVSIIGMALGAIMIPLFILFSALALIFSVFISGTWLSKYIFKTEKYLVDWKAIVVGTLLIQVLGIIPVVGWIGCFGFFLVGFGSLFNTLFNGLRKSN